MNEEKEDMVIYSTSDIYFAGYLSAIDLPLIRTEKETEHGKTKVIFVFKVPKVNFDRIKTSFFGGTGTVKVLKYVQALKSLKSLCYV